LRRIDIQPQFLTAPKECLMDEIKLVSLFEIREEQIIDLMNNEMVGKQLPLLAGGFSVEDCQNFFESQKADLERLWIWPMGISYRG